MDERFSTIVIYKNINCADKNDHERYEKTLNRRRSHSNLNMELKKDGKYHVYTNRFEIGILDKETTLRLKAACPTNCYLLYWKSEYYQYITFSDGTKSEHPRLAGAQIEIKAIQWICPKCRNRVGSFLDFCFFCGTKKPSGDSDIWICKKCGSIEDIKHDVCSRCGEKKDSFLITSTQWKCLACGNVNDAMDDAINNANDFDFRNVFCDKCGAKRGERETPAQKRAREAEINYNGYVPEKGEGTPEFAEREYQSWYEEEGKYADEDYNPFEKDDDEW